ncbi:MAG TPA: NADH-quinone oxidoreductase subunit NuoE [Candidatus Mailhella excrementigallinarum]|nr:MAG: NADH-quinone oxidoreductase subunit NuoE [Desulfovibrionaceae bacterium]HIV66230.1 NADH-quinone oxidoreductase subunit NuoE [Candidatus Mailhella excrementigallinarum]
MACQCSATGEFDLAPLMEILSEYKDNPKGALIPVLQKAQGVYGYLPKPVLETIARELRLTTAEVFGVVTFYAQFHLNPRGKHIIRVCQGTACHVRGGAKILEAVSEHLKVKPGETTRDLEFTLETVACLGACGLAPVMMVDDNTHGRLNPLDIPGILDSYLS